MDHENQDSTWPERVRESLAPLSVEKHDVRIMLKEWHRNGEFNDLEDLSGECELCGYKGIRYQFGIENPATENQLLVGSDCILRFYEEVMDADEPVVGSGKAHEKLRGNRNKLLSDARKSKVIRAIIGLARDLAREGTTFDLQTVSLLEKYASRGAFTPAELYLMVSQLDAADIPYKKSDLKMIIKREEEKEELRKMDLREVERISECMSPSQKKWYRIEVGLSK